MTEQSKMPARIWAHPPASTKGCLISFTTPSADYNVAYIRADLVEQMAEALRRSREAVNAVVLSTHSVSFDADLRAIDTALSTYAAAVGSKEVTP